MADYSHILFNKSPMQLRLLGARGGRAFGRNQRARRALSPPPPEVLSLAPLVRETTPEAIAVLEIHSFPGSAVQKSDAPAGNQIPRREKR